MPTPKMHRYSYPIETEEAMKFFASRHICNRVKAIIAFSRTPSDALRNLRNNLPRDFKHNNHHFRRRAVHAFQNYVNQPDMKTVPFSPLSIPWWECIPHDPIPPAKGHWAVWDDTKDWEDNEDWVEWIDDPAP